MTLIQTVSAYREALIGDGEYVNHGRATMEEHTVAEFMNQFFRETKTMGPRRVERSTDLEIYGFERRCPGEKMSSGLGREPSRRSKAHSPRL